MDGSFVSMIDTRIVYGFAGAGKTTYIRDCIRNDYFYKYGTTLILCFEQGEETYDPEELQKRNASVVYYGGEKSIAEFCMDPVRKFHPDRIYLEMNTAIPMLREQLPACLQVTSVVTWFDWQQLDFHLMNCRQMIRQMVSESRQITFRDCPSKELLAPYSQEFQLLNHQASYLRQDPMGYHEKAFDLFLPYDLEEERITISEASYLVFWLDAAEHPEHYERKNLCFSDPLELRHVVDEIGWSAGRTVMTCCMADLQFMSLELLAGETEDLSGGWADLDAIGVLTNDTYGRKVLKLMVTHIVPSPPPQSGILMAGALKQNKPGPAGKSGLSEALYRRISKSKS